MKRVLIIKTSSLGDIIHTLPALTDVQKVFPDVQFDWVVEESFQAIPKMHPAVNKVIPIAFRRWRKGWLKALFKGELKRFVAEIRQEPYDYIIDMQGLLKSAFISLLCRGKRYGLCLKSAREPLASFFYHTRVSAPWTEHAVARIRRAFAGIFHYPVPDYTAEYAITAPTMSPEKSAYCVFLHGTTWATKHWPLIYWIELAKKVTKAGYGVKLPWGNNIEYIRAQTIAKEIAGVEVLPKMGLIEVASVLQGASAIVTVDTGLGHLAAALNIPTVSLYGPTDPKETGTFGANQTHLAANFSCAPCFKRACTYKGKESRKTEPPCFGNITPEQVFTHLLLKGIRCI